MLLMNQPTTKPEPLTYTENGHTSTIVCAFCVEEGNEVPATQKVGPWPACQKHGDNR